MKINAEKFLDNFNQYKFEKKVFFITGNEEGQHTVWKPCYNGDTKTYYEKYHAK